MILFKSLGVYNDSLWSNDWIIVILVVGFVSFFAHCWQVQIIYVISYLLWVILGRFFLVVGCFRSFLVRRSLFQIIVGHFRSVRILINATISISIKCIYTYIKQIHIFLCPKDFLYIYIYMKKEYRNKSNKFKVITACHCKFSKK